MRVRWHQFWLFLCALGLWWWGYRDPPPDAPWTATVVAHDVGEDRRTVTRVAFVAPPDGAPKVARLVRPGLRHEPGQVVAVRPVPGEPAMVDEWTGREWPWLGWLVALTLAHGLALVAAAGAPKPRFQAWAGTAVGLCWLTLLWFAVLQASQARVDLLRDGVRAEGVVVDSEILTRSSGRSRARADAIVHFAAPAARPPRDVQINAGVALVDGARVPLLYLPESPSRILILPDSGATWSAWWWPGALVLGSLWLTVLWGQVRLRMLRAATAAGMSS